MKHMGKGKSERKMKKVFFALPLLGIFCYSLYTWTRDYFDHLVDHYTPKEEDLNKDSWVMKWDEHVDTDMEEMNIP